MEKRVFKLLKSKKFRTHDDFTVLIVLCQELFDKNEEIERQFRGAFHRIIELEQRLSFYRSVTAPKIAE